MFYFELAFQLGYPHPDHLLKCLTSEQITEWAAYFHVKNTPQDKVIDIEDPEEKTAALKQLMFGGIKNHGTR